MNKNRLIGLFLLVTLTVTACAGANPTPTPEDMMAESPPTEAMMETETPMVEMMDATPTAEMMMDVTPTGEMMDETPTTEHMMDETPTAEAMMDEMMGPDWFSAELIDVNTGESFSIADFEGQVILVETMAIWCSNCLRQQREVKALHESMGERDDFVTVVLDIDPNEGPDNLQAYAEKHGFDWIYAVAPREVAREIGQLYGDQFLNPPSTPMLIIDRHGEVHLLPFGRKSAESLEETLNAHLNESM